MSTRAERDQARVRCLTVAIGGLYCELAHIIQESEAPDQLEQYASENMALMNRDDGSLVGLNVPELMELLGSISGVEKLIADGHSADAVRVFVALAPSSASPLMKSDILLYIEAITKDRASTAPPQASEAEIEA